LVYKNNYNLSSLGEKGLVFNIERYAVHDGPGIRTIIFLQGCPLRCAWCQNPEGQELLPQIAYFEEKCTFCGRCIEVCENEALYKRNSKIITDLSKCLRCGKCTEKCPNEARKLLTNIFSPEEVIDIVSKDEPFYRRSGGGITLSGGEPFFQSAFSSRILKLAKDRGINTCVETCGYFDWDEMIKIEMFKFVDLLYFDIKNMDSQKHKEETGVKNAKILTNFKRLCELGKKIIVRIPVITNFNDSENNIYKTAEFISNSNSGNIIRIELLPYHEFGVKKYHHLGKDYYLKNLKPPPKNKLLEIKGIIDKYNIECTIL